MTIEKATVVDQITIEENGVVFARQTTILSEGDQVLSRSYHRTSLVPGQDVTSYPENVQTICKAAWTPEVVQAYKNSVNRA